MKNNFYRLYGKRLFDLIVVFPASLILLPFLILVSLIVIITDGWPVIFTQIRVGKNFKEFRLYKFRSMTTKQSGSVSLVTVKGDDRITRIGRILRKYKLDELPQVFNVLFGKMSIVGPRPEVSQYVNAFKKDYQLILSVKPGIADYATLEFHNEEEILNQYENHQQAYIDKILPQKIKLYNEYIKDQSLRTDIKVIYKTIRNLLK